MMTKDFREILADDLQDPEFRRNFLVAYYEENGVEGLRAALDEIALASEMQKPLVPKITSTDFSTLRDTLNTLGLDFRLVPMPEGDTSNAALAGT